MKINWNAIGYTTVLSVAIGTSAQGQIVPDRSLGTAVERQGEVAEITGGSQAGSNLFHSFQDFSVSTGGTAFFNNGLEIDNILSRVTGGRISSIDGLIRANGDANLFLLNPAGIIFGENARLDIGGSFLGSTAVGLLFEDGTEFGADINSPVLTINAPIGLNLRDTVGDIASTGNLNSDRQLTLAARNLNLEGELTADSDLSLEAVDTLAIADSPEQAFIATAGEQLSLQGGNIEIGILAHPDSRLLAGGNLTLISDRPIDGDARYYSGGSFDVTKLDGSPGILVSLDDPIIQSQDDVTLGDYTGASLHIQSGGNVTIAGDITITGVDVTESIQEIITLSNGNRIEIDGGSEPTLDIRAGTNSVDFLAAIELRSQPPIKSGSQISIDGRVSNPGGKVYLTNQYQPNLELAAGDITVNSIDTSNANGDGGDVIIDARRNLNLPVGINTAAILDAQLLTLPNSEVNTTDLVTGDGGAIALLATENISTGDLTTAAGINLTLLTEVDTIDEANSNITFPQANLQTGTGGSIDLKAGNNINTGNLNSSATVTIATNSQAVDSFSIIGAGLNLDLENAGSIELDAGNNLNTAKINSYVRVNNRLVSNAETTPNLTLSVSQLFLNVPEVNLGSGGEIFLVAGKTITTFNLDSSVTVESMVNNTAGIVAEDPQIATPERPSRAVSTVNGFYSDINLARGGAIKIESDRANLGELNSSIGISSTNTVFAQSTTNNNSAASASANSDLEFQGIGDRPGEIILDVANNLSFTGLNATSEIQGINNQDSQANAIDGDNNLALADNTSSNIIVFDSAVNFALIRLNLNPPDVNHAMIPQPSVTLTKFQPATLDRCPTNTAKQDTPQPIETAQGKIYPARGAVIKDGELILTATPVVDAIQRQPQSSCGF